MTWQNILKADFTFTLDFDRAMKDLERNMKNMPESNYTTAALEKFIEHYKDGKDAQKRGKRVLANFHLGRMLKIQDEIISYVENKRP